MNTGDFFEPAEAIEYRAVDIDHEYMRDEDGDYQQYGSVVIGWNLDNPEGDLSFAEIVTGDGREKDEAVAAEIVRAIRAWNTRPTEGMPEIEKVRHCITQTRDGLK